MMLWLLNEICSYATIRKTKLLTHFIEGSILFLMQTLIKRSSFEEDDVIGNNIAVVGFCERALKLWPQWIRSCL